MATTPCSNSPCIWGRCTVVGSTYRCDCNVGYEGRNCDISDYQNASAQFNFN